MPSGQELETRILSAAAREFFQHGFSRVTMDELSSKIGISKKTLYQYFPGKDQLVRSVIMRHMESARTGVAAILHNEDEDFILRLKNMMKIIGTHISAIGRSFIEDLKKNAPHIWEEIDEMRQELIKEYFARMFKEGVESKVFRSDINPELFMVIYANTIRSVMNPEIIAQVPFMVTELFESIIDILFNGIITDQARSKYIT
jgi:AcrR family transcriptional regulator